MFHVRPQVLATRLGVVVEDERCNGAKVLLVYGDCCTQMAALETLPGVVRTRASNCCELLLGKASYRRYSRDGAFFLLPEWARRWRHVFSAELGLDRSTAADLMGDMHRKLVYLDTGLSPVPSETLNACAGFCGLPWERCAISLEPLRLAIQEALARLEGDSVTQ